MQRVLVANRGEIAVRVFRTCRELDLETVAVYTADDRDVLHVRVAQQAVEVESYLDPQALVAAALKAGADTIHPGYGFLAESPAFAEAVVTAGLSWVGPPAEVIALGGDKLASKAHAIEAGVPVLPSGSAHVVGAPLIVKAAAGGGGRGMRIVHDLADLDQALAAASREAQAAFGDGTVFCERYVARPRHVEVQLLSDTHGNVVALGERECSIQRRHQKVLEETPSPGIDAATRAAILAAAIAFARQIDYVGAGTAEFLVSGDELFFLELNARIQVEHPITEAVTGIDIVAEQLRIAQGLPLEPQTRTCRGHAIEARLCAEDPLTFAPQVGTIEELRFPEALRVDAGVAEGDEIGHRFDSLIAKLIVHAPTREEALAALADGLERTVVRGVRTNLPFLRWLVAHPAVRAGETTTSFLEDHPPLSRRPRRAAAAWAGPFRVNLTDAPVLPPPRELETGRGAPGTDDRIVAPIAGTVIAVEVAVGEQVRKHQRLLVLEAMKLEMPIDAPQAGVVVAVNAVVGSAVAQGEVLVELGETPDDADE
ncbi:MAG: biotin carboxylase N-terminal domain-containing protein [Gaiellales bacterium]